MPRLSVSIEGIRRLQKRLRILKQRVRVAGDSIIDEAAEETAAFAAMEAPYGQTKYGKIGGTLRGSIEIVKRLSERKVGPNLQKASYAPYVIAGTQRSPGRFVPAIGKRLRQPSRTNPDIGEHPGTPANPFMYRAYQRIRRILRNIVEGITRRVLG